jgi:molecular chaperone DnaJ
MSGQGNAGKNGGPPGDLLVVVGVNPHPQFKRSGTSVLFDMPISFSQAALGAEVEVPTLDGMVKYTIPEGTQTATVFRLRDKGIPHLRGHGRGDQLVTVNIVTPKKLNSEQKELLRKFAEASGESSGKDKKGKRK